MQKQKLAHLNGRHPNWEKLYQTQSAHQIPWHSEQLDSDLAEAIIKFQGGSILDVGCGTGSQTHALSQLGFDALGTDIAESAIQCANRGTTRAKFLCDDILKTTLVKSFDFIFDRGCFHVLEPNQHATYIHNIYSLLSPNGRLFLKVFSPAQPKLSFGPLRYSIPMIHQRFSTKFQILKIKHTVFEGQTETPPKAFFAILKPRK